MTTPTASHCFSSLPQDFYNYLAPFMQPCEVLAVSLTCRRMRESFRWPLQSRVTLDGLDQMIKFVESCLEDNDVEIGPTCFFGHPLPRPLPSSPRKRKEDGRGGIGVTTSRASKVRHLELFEPGPARLEFDWACYETDKRLLFQDKLNKHIPGGILGTTVRLTPNLTSLHVYQSSLALTPALAISLATWTPLLRSLHFHSIHTDATSLAFVLQHCPRIQDLDVSGVKSCQCHGKSGVKAAGELGASLARCSNLKRLVLRASRAACEDDGILLRQLARTSVGGKARQSRRAGQDRCFSADRHRIYQPNGQVASSDGLIDDGGNDDDGRPALQDLELHRLALPASALIEFLSSPASSQITHLFLGGLRKVRASHLSEGAAKVIDAPSPSPSFFTANTPISLQSDASLLSTSFLQRVGKRVSHLRIYEPKGHLISTAIHSGLLPNLTSLVILPAEQDLELWSEHGAWRKRVEMSAYESLFPRQLDIRVGDQQWKAVVEEKRAMRAHQDQLQRQADVVAEQSKQTAYIASLGGAAWSGGPLPVAE